MLFSFVLPAYKSRFLKEALDSILAQTYIDFELIIVDDASPENIKGIVDLYDDLRLLYYRNPENIGGKDLVAQWNHSISFAKGDYIILASDDDKYAPEYLEEIERMIRRFPDVNVFRPRISYINTNSEVIYSEPESNDIILSRLGYLQRMVEGKLMSGVPQYVFKRKALIENQGFVNFPMAWASDDVTVVALADKGLAIVNKPLFYFRYSDINISGRSDTIQTMRYKLKAATMYFDYISNILNSDPNTKELLEALKIRAQQGSISVITNCSFRHFLNGLYYMREIKSDLFPAKWRYNLLMSHIQNKLRHKLTGK